MQETQEQTKTSPWLARLLAGVLALGLLILSFNGYGFLVFLGPGLLYLALERLTWYQKLLFLLVWGVVFSAIFNTWALRVTFSIWISLTFSRGLPWLLFCIPQLLMAKLQPDRADEGPWAALGAGLGMALVSFGHLLGAIGYDFEAPAATLAAWPWCLTCLPWLGLEGFSFLIGFVSRMLLDSKNRNRLLGVLLLAGWGMLSWLLFQNRPQDPIPEQLRIALLQTGWDELDKWAPENRKESIHRLFEMTKQARNKGASLIVWPETAWPFYSLRQRRGDTRAISDLAREVEADLLVSSVEETAGDRWFNSVSQVTPTGRFAQEYKKRRLLPFAEYLPVPEQWRSKFLNFGPYGEHCRYVPGDDAPILEHQNLKYCILICFETMVPRLAARTADEVDFFIVMTNDGMLRGGFAKEAHFRSAVLRAAQFRKPIFQAGNEGVTGIIDSYGTVLKRTPPDFTERTILTFFQESSPQTGARD